MKPETIEFSNIDFEFVLKSLPGYVYWKDRNSIYRGCNQKAAALIGLADPAEIIGKSDYELPWGGVLEMVNKARADERTVITTGKSIVSEDRIGIKNENGLEIILKTEKVPLFDKGKNIIGTLGIGVDITELKFQEQQKIKNIIEQETQFSEQTILDEQLKILQIIDGVDASIYWKDLNGVILGCNQFVVNMFGVKDRKDIIGRNEYDLLPEEEALRITNIDQHALANGRTIGEETFTLPTGEKVVHYVVKNRLIDSDNNVIGLVGTSVDITARIEKEQLAKENEVQKVKLEGKEKLINLSRKVAHDIASPLSTLNIMANLCVELDPDKRRLLINAARGILDIANNLLNTYRNVENFLPDSQYLVEEEPRQLLFLFDSITQLVSEKRVQYGGRSISLDAAIDDNAQFAFALMQPVQLRRALSNLINNAVDAVETGSTGMVTVHVTVDYDQVTISVKDNGKGMPQAMIDNLLQRQFFTLGKENGHGLGWQQVWDTIDQNQGTITGRSSLGVGTSIDMTFPRVAAPDWIEQEIHINETDIIVILDDDESLQGAVALRFSPYLERHPNLHLHHFTQGQAALDLLTRFTTEEKKDVMLLIDYDLFGQDKDGIDIIEISQIQRTTLITGYYMNPEVQSRIQKLGVKVLPKHMAATIPVYMNE